MYLILTFTQVFIDIIHIQVVQIGLFVAMQGASETHVIYVNHSVMQLMRPVTWPRLGPGMLGVFFELAFLLDGRRQSSESFKLEEALGVVEAKRFIGPSFSAARGGGQWKYGVQRVPTLLVFGDDIIAAIPSHTFAEWISQRTPWVVP
jgi:hypothetical protein